MSNDDLLDLMVANIITGNRDTTAQNVRNLITAMIGSYQNLDGKNAADGYLGVDSQGNANFSIIKAFTPVGAFLRDDGSFHDISLVQTFGAAAAMNRDISYYTYSGPAGSSWTTVEVEDDKEYMIFNRGGAALTLNYPGGLNKIYDMTAGTPGNSIVVPKGSIAIIIDDGSYLAIKVI